MPDWLPDAGAGLGIGRRPQGAGLRQRLLRLAGMAEATIRRGQADAPLHAAGPQRQQVAVTLTGIVVAVGGQQQVGLEFPGVHDRHPQLVARQQPYFEVVCGLEQQLHLVALVLRAGQRRLDHQPGALGLTEWTLVGSQALQPDDLGATSGLQVSVLPGP